MIPMKYYQVGGFRGHLQWFKDDDSSEGLTNQLMRIFRDNGELVLGIRPNGASYLLLPVGYCEHHLGARSRFSWDATDFESLSPIQFGERKDLVEKLSSLVSSRKNKHDAPRDRSRANTEFTTAGDGKSQSGEVRSSFEHQRVLYRLLQKALVHPEHFAVSRPAPPSHPPAESSLSWFDNVRIYSFAFNLWGGDRRSLDKRLAEPQVLDVGWTEFDSPSDETDLRAVSTTHLIVEEERYLGNPGRTRLALPDVSQFMAREEISNLLKTSLASQDAGENSPILLLVHDEKITKCVLKWFGVDTSTWASGIKHLLYNPGRDSNGQRWGGRTSVQRGDCNSRSTWSRERSRSPGRWRTNERDIRSRSPFSDRHTGPAPVYIVDIRVLYRYLMKVPPGQDDSIILNAKALSVKDTAVHRGEDNEIIYEDINPKEWCAGRESRLLGYLWETMAVGSAIDEQRAFRNRFAREEVPTPVLSAPSQPTDADEVDPNDLMQPTTHGQMRINSGQALGLFDSDDEEWDDY